MTLHVTAFVIIGGLVVLGLLVGLGLVLLSLLRERHDVGGRGGEEPQATDRDRAA
jgi:hypothetical protein